MVLANLALESYTKCKYSGTRENRNSCINLTDSPVSGLHIKFENEHPECKSTVFRSLIYETLSYERYNGQRLKFYHC